MACPRCAGGRLVPALLAAAFATVNADAQTKPPSAAVAAGPPAVGSDAADTWHLRLGIPIWLAGLDGTLTVRGSELEPSEDPSDIDLFGSHLDGAAALHAEAEKRTFGLIFDSMYVDVGATANTSIGAAAEGSVQGFVGELDAFYIVTRPEPGVGWGALAADVLAGVRFTRLDLGVDTAATTASSSHWVVDPLVGGRIEVGLTDWLGYKLRGDIGGFGLASDLTWNVDTAFAFHFSKLFQMDLGYRWLDYDFSKGSGTDQSGLDLTLEGPYLGVQFAFVF